MNVHPSLERARELAQDYNLIPLRAELSADLETPVSAFLKVCGDRRPAFLLESVEQGEQLGRYSFIGCEPLEVLRYDDESPWQGLRETMAGYRPAPSDLPFAGGAVGFWGYEAVRHLEPRVGEAPDDRGLPESCFMLSSGLLVFDHVRRIITLVQWISAGDDLERSYSEGVRRLEEWAARLSAPLGAAPLSLTESSAPLSPRSNQTREDFEVAVLAAQDRIRAGDCFQIVLSQRLEVPFEDDPFTLYRVLRQINPSPYMFFMDWGGFQLVGSSPEVMVRLDGRTATLRPIAGTRRRGELPDAELAAELLADPKERAEHVMLVDLGRNDLGRVCRKGSVQVDELMTLERYSHVLHLVSNVRGELEEGLDGLDLLASGFPAGTVSGAPKIRAMEIIAELEPTRRGPYAGAVGVLGFDGLINTGITIRTVVVAEGQAYVQAGAGIVADSTPSGEYQETLNKAQALLTAIALAKRSPS